MVWMIMVWMIAIIGILFLGGIGVGMLQGTQRIYGDTSLILSDGIRQDILTGYLQLWFFSIFIKSVGFPLNTGKCVAIGMGLAFVYRLAVGKIRSKQHDLTAEDGKWTDYIDKAGMLGAVSIGLLGWGLSVMMVRQHFDPGRDLNTLDYMFGFTLLSFGIGGLSGVMAIRAFRTVVIDHQKKRIRQLFQGSIIGALAGGWIYTIVHPHVPILTVYAAGGVIGGVMSGFLTGGWMISSRPLTMLVTSIGWDTAKLVALLLSGIRFNTIICGHCYRYSAPLRSRYDKGKRYCGYCQSEIPFTYDPGKVIVTFGNISPEQDGRIFVLSNPDFEQKEQPIDVSVVYIDTETCDSHLVERFITYIVNYPPRHGMRSVRIFYNGKLAELGENLKNALRNNFEHLKKLESASHLCRTSSQNMRVKCSPQ